jgi:hypothetical protein
MLMDAANKIEPASVGKASPGKQMPEACDQLGRRWAAALCSFLLVAFATLAWSASLGKSPTIDEPCHALSGWLQLWKQNDRLICDHPPLWSTLAAFATGPDAVQADLRKMDALDLPVDRVGELVWIDRTLFRTPGNAPFDFIRRFRAMMLAAAVGMGSMLAAFTWRIARASGSRASAAAAATVLATGLFAMDPNFLAHSPLMKNDVASALAMLALIAATWAAGRALTANRLLVLGLCCGAALMIKLNAPFMIASSVMLLFGRAIAPWPWLIGLRLRTAHLCVSPRTRIGAAAMSVVIMSAMTFGMIWLSYGFRFAPTNAPGRMLDLSNQMNLCIAQQWQAMHGVEGTPIEPTLEQLAATPRPIIVKLAGWASGWRVLPQAFITGVLFTVQSARDRPNFLLGHYSVEGTWWYFPFAMAVKTPLATLAALAATGGVAGQGVWRSWQAPHLSGPSSGGPSRLPEGWTVACLVVPVVIYLAAAMASNMNLGIRHVLPLYPPLFALAGLVMAKVWDWRPRFAFAAGLLVLSVLAVESCSAYPDYIPFFNVVAGGSRGGLSCCRIPTWIGARICHCWRHGKKAIPTSGCTSTTVDSSTPGTTGSDTRT